MRQKRYQKASKAHAVLRPSQEEAHGGNVTAVEVETHVEEQGIQDEMQALPEIQVKGSEQSQDAACAGEKIGEGKESDTAIGLQNLAAFYHVQGYYQEAEKLYRQALEIFEREKEQDIAPTAIATTLRNLALLYENQDRYQEAEEFYRRAQSAMQQASEGERSTAISIMRDYADLLRILGREQEAQEMEARITI